MLSAANAANNDVLTMEAEAKKPLPPAEVIKVASLCDESCCPLPARCGFTADALI